jgi:hypothetical protein
MEIFGYIKKSPKTLLNKGVIRELPLLSEPEVRPSHYPTTRILTVP